VTVPDAPQSWLRCRLQELVLAFGLLTRLPMPRLIIHRYVPLPDYLWAFPIVGFVVGHVAALTYLLAREEVALGTSLATLLALAASILVTGALHEDGLADFADGVGGGRTRERKLEIMRDSSIGTYGAVALILVLAVRWSALASITDLHAAAGVLVLSHTSARGLLAVIPEYWRPARADGISASAGKGNLTSSAVAIGLTIAVALLLDAGPVALASVLAAAGGIVAVAAVASRYLGGYTGDVFGAAEQIAETLALLAAVSVLNH
jgi:adenosylcobinamide-GDP ribazoletransferase